MAEDEEDDMFGDFKFVSYSNSNQINKANDDDWGDFMATTSPKQDLFGNSLQFQPSNGFSFTQNPSNTFEFSPSFDPLDIASKPIESKLNHVESGKNLDSPSPVVGKRWEKIRGALPLSIFGDEEEESDAVDQSSDGVHEIFSSKLVSRVNSGSNFGSSVSFNDLIGNLYGQQAQNGSNLNVLEDSNGKIEQIKVENRPNSNLVENSHGVNGQIKVENGSNSILVEENCDFDEDDWEFKDAVFENRGGDSDFGVKKEENVMASWATQTEASSPAVTATKTTTTTAIPTNPNERKIQVDGTMYESSEGSIFGFNNNAQHDGDWFVASEGNSYNPTIIDNGFHLEPGVSTANIWNPDTLSQSKQIATENGENTLGNDSFESDESFGDFSDAFPKIEALDGFVEQQEELKITDQAGVEMKRLSDEFQGNGKASENNREALPLSIFSDGKLDSDDSLFGQEVFSFKPTTSVRNEFHTQVSSSNLSLNDLISDLYSQAENVPAVGSTHEHTENRLTSAQTGLSSNLANVEDDFDESSWEFKAAFSETKDEYSSPVVGLGHIHQKFPTESKITSFMDFYSRLKEEAGFIILHHLDDLKNDQKVAALSGEDAKEKAIHEEIETVKKLLQANMISEDAYLKEHAPKSICMNELLVAMEEPKFQVLESEYHLSQRISLAEQNLRSAIGLFEHAISVVKILNLGSGGGLFNYATTWSRMISACAQELKHGASIWKQSLEKNVHKQILSKSQGQRYILALGEIYRVAEVLRVSAIFYKPSILSSLVNPMDFFASLEECNSIWSNSGIDEALQCLSDPVGIGYDGSAKALLESIKSIHDLIDLDVPSPQNNVSLPEQICRLSLLSLKMVPDMKMVLWNEEHYFLSLANFWGNLISCDPPKLPHIQVNF